jgi:hypothetical protein
MQMIHIDWADTNSLAVAKMDKPAVYIANSLNYDKDDEHIWKFVMQQIHELYPVEKYPAIMGELIHGGLFFFDNEYERDVFYNIFQQKLTDSSAIYACVYDADGTCITENT